MVQEIELEQLAACPFCGGRAVMKIADAPLGDGQVVRINCACCHVYSNAYYTGKMAFSEHIVTLEEAKQKAVQAWNKRHDEEIRREIFVQSLSMAQVELIMEAEKFYQYSTAQETRFCRGMAKVYGCVPKEGNEENLMDFLTTLYHYGIVQ